MRQLVIALTALILSIGVGAPSAAIASSAGQSQQATAVKILPPAPKLSQLKDSTQKSLLRKETALLDIVGKQVCVAPFGRSAMQQGVETGQTPEASVQLLESYGAGAYVPYAKEFAKALDQVKAKHEKVPAWAWDHVPTLYEVIMQLDATRYPGCATGAYSGN